MSNVIEINVSAVCFDYFRHWERVYTKEATGDGVSVRASQGFVMKDGTPDVSHIIVDKGRGRHKRSITLSENDIDGLIEDLKEAKKRLIEVRKKPVRLIKATRK